MFKPPECFTFAKPELCKEWKQRFSRFRIASKLDKEPETIQINSLLYSMGSEAEKVFVQLTFAEGEADQYDKSAGKAGRLFHAQSEHYTRTLNFSSV